MLFGLFHLKNPHMGRNGVLEMTIQEIQQVFINHGIPDVYAAQEASAVLRDLIGYPGNRLAGLQTVIQQRIFLFLHQQKQQEKKRELRNRFLKRKVTQKFEVEYI
jgi:hypothetical protein